MNDPSAGASGKKPLAVFAVVERENKPSIWIRVGSAYANRDGSINLFLDAFPIGTNKLQVREQRFDDGPRPNGNGAARAAMGEEVRP